MDVTDLLHFDLSALIEIKVVYGRNSLQSLIEAIGYFHEIDLQESSYHLGIDDEKRIFESF
jgi:hypothetical protein